MFCPCNSSVAIWIGVSSIVHWAHDYAVKSSQSNLGLRSANILWHGNSRNGVVAINTYVSFSVKW